MVLILVILISTYLGLVDMVLTRLMKVVIG